MYGYESWTIKKAECRRIDAFELSCWRRFLRVNWPTTRSNQLGLKEINPEYSLEGQMMKLKFQYFGHLMWRADSLEMTLILGKIKCKRRGQQKMKWLDNITDSVDMKLSKVWEIVKDGEAWHAAAHGAAKSQTRLSNWATTTTRVSFIDTIPYHLPINTRRNHWWSREEKWTFSQLCQDSKQLIEILKNFNSSKIK